jgi:hypothetical protein
MQQVLEDITDVQMRARRTCGRAMQRHMDMTDCKRQERRVVIRSQLLGNKHCHVRKS